jgi:hypothetical protein
MVMTEGFRNRVDAALDEAVRDTDPMAEVAEVVRRYHRGRRRTTVSCVAGVVALAILGVGAIGQLGARTPGPGTAVSIKTPSTTAPAIPLLIDGEVIVDGLTVPVPDGWQAIDRRATYCDIPPRTVVVGFDPVPGGEGRHCGLKPIIIVAAQGQWSSERRAVRQLTLPGGQPAWVATGSSNVAFGKRPGYNVARLYLPWSRAMVGLTLEADEFAAVLASIRARPTQPSALVLPAHVNVVSSTYRGAPQRSADPAAVAEVLRRLGGLSDAVSDKRVCAHPDLPALAIDLQAGSSSATVVITLSSTCMEVTSSLGGRVSAPQGYANDIWRMLGGSGTVEPA